MLVNRARVLRVKTPHNLLESFRSRLTWHERIFDTYELLSFGRTFDGCGCDDCAKAFGIEGKLGSGADFPELWKADQNAAIAYNKRDCEIEIQLADICGY
jgi:hypothetical protein